MNKDEMKKKAARIGLVNAGGLRSGGDFSEVELFISDDAKHLIAHTSDFSDSVVLEVHDSMSKDGTEQLDECQMLCFKLDPEKRFELATYLLSTLRSNTII